MISPIFFIFTLFSFYFCFFNKLLYPRRPINFNVSQFQQMGDKKVLFSDRSVQQLDKGFRQSWDRKNLKQRFIEYLMSTEQEVEVYAYTLNIQSVKMKVKFVCKMRLEHNGVSTPEVSLNDAGKFIFNHEFTLKQDTDQSMFEIVAHLTTEKGAKYIAGVIRLMQNELVHQQGQMLIVPLSKCLDSDASCQLRVDQVTSEKVTRKIGIDKVMMSRYKDGNRDNSPGKLLSPKNYKGTRSEFQFPLHNKPNRDWDGSKGRQEIQSIYNRNRSPGMNFKKTHVAATNIDRYPMQMGIQSTNRDKLIEGQVYKESYQKLKQKYKKEAQSAKHELNRRLALESAQNNYKLEIMRLKLRNEEQQKSLTEKNQKIKQFQVQLANLQKKQLDLQYLKEQNANKDHTIKMLEDTIRTLNKDNEDLKNLNKQRFEGEQMKIKQLRAEIDSVKHKNQEKMIQIEYEMRSKAETIFQKELQIKQRDERIEREQKLVGELEKVAQNKMMEFERAIQAEKNQSKLKIDELKGLIERLEKQKSRLQNQLQEAKSDNQKVKSYVVKIEYDKKITNQQNDGFKAQLAELKIIKQKYQQLTRQHRLLTEDKNHLQKQFQKTLQSKEGNITDLNRQYQEQLDHYKKIYREVDDKHRAALNKSLELETGLEQKKNQCEKLRKNNENLTKQLNDLKEKEKNVSHTLKIKEEKLSALTSEMDSFRNKTKSGDQMSRYEIENLKEELAKLKKQYEAECLKASQLGEKNFNLSSQVGKLKMQVQYGEDQAQKTAQIHREKSEAMEATIKENERKIEDLSHTIANLRTAQKQNQTKIQNMQIDGLKTNDKIEKLNKQIRNLQQKVQHCQNIIKNKQQQITQLQNAKQGVQKRLTQTQQRLGSTKNNYNTMTGEKNKNEKIIELLNKQINELKQQGQRLNKFILQKQKIQGDLRGQIKKNKQDYLKLQMKFNAMKKQYEKFKDTLVDTLHTTFSQIPISQANNPDLRSSHVVGEILGKRSMGQVDGEVGIPNAEVINKASSQNKEVKAVMTKLIQQNRALQKEINQLNEHMTVKDGKVQNNEQAMNRQIQNLQQQLQKVYIEKEQNAMNLGRQIIELKEEIQQKQENIQELTAQAEELNFTINSLKMDEESKTEHYNFKNNQYKSKISELEDKISFLTSGMDDLEAKLNKMQKEKEETSQQLQNQRQIVEKRDKQIEELSAEKNGLFHANEEGKKYRKQLVEKISELQLKLNTEIQSNQKSRQLLNDEEHKGSELKEFVANLMKQKEAAIKSDLEKSEQIITLEGQIIELNRDKDMQSEENERIKKTNEELKELIKKLNGQIKDLEMVEVQEKGKGQKLSQKLKDTQRQLKQANENYEKLRQQNDKFVTKSNKEINDLQSQLEDLYKLKEGLSSDMTDRINQQSRDLREAESKINSLKNEITILQQNLFAEKQQGEIKSQQVIRLTDELDQAKKDLKNANQNIKKLNEELKDKEETMFELSGKIYNLQMKVQSKEKEKHEKVEETIQDWSTKYDMICDQYDQRIQLVEKEREYFKERLQEKQQQFRKTMAQLRNNQLDEANIRKVLEDKVKRLEDDRLNLISTKNSEIQRLAEENKGSFESMKSKEADIRRIQHELQVARSTITKLENNKKQTEQKIRHINKVYQGELQQLKRRQASNRVSRDILGKIKWDIQREIKKTIGTFSKKLIAGQPKQSTHKIITNLKEMEENLNQMIKDKMGQNKE